MIVNRKRAEQIAERMGFFWSDCDLCGEMFAGFESGRFGLWSSPRGGKIVCSKPGCQYQAWLRQFFAPSPYADEPHVVVTFK